MMKEHLFDEKIYFRKNEFRPDRQTLVFVHGLSGSSSAWLKYEEKFKDKYNVLSMDLRGHGKSWKPKKYDAYAMNQFAEDLRKLFVELNLKDCILVSHSFGTLIALEFLARHQNMVKAAVFLSPGYKIGHTFLEKLLLPFLHVSHALELFPWGGKTGKHIDYAKYPNSGDWNIPRTIADVSNTSLRAYAFCTKQSYQVDRENFLKEIHIPVLIVHGKKDTIFSVKNGIIMAKKIKNAELLILENANHIIVLNNFLEVSGAIEKFLEKHP